MHCAWRSVGGGRGRCGNGEDARRGRSCARVAGGLLLLLLQRVLGIGLWRADGDAWVGDGFAVKGSTVGRLLGLHDGRHVW